MAAYIADERKDIVRKYQKSRVSAERLDKAKSARDLKLIREMVAAAVKLNGSIQSASQTNPVFQLLATIEEHITKTQTDLSSEVAKVKKELQEDIDDYDNLMETGDIQYIITRFTNDMQVNGVLVYFYLAVLRLQVQMPKLHDGYKSSYTRLKNVHEELDASSDFHVAIRWILQTPTNIFDEIGRGSWNGTWLNQSYNLPTSRMKQSITRFSEAKAALLAAVDLVWKPVRQYAKCAVELLNRLPAPDSASLFDELKLNIYNETDVCIRLWRPLERLIEEELVSASSRYSNAVQKPVRSLHDHRQALTNGENNMRVAVDILKNAIQKLRTALENPHNFINSTILLINDVSKQEDLLKTWTNVSKADLADTYASPKMLAALKSAAEQTGAFIQTHDDVLNRELEKALERQTNLAVALREAKGEIKKPWPRSEEVKRLLSKGRDQQKALGRLVGNFENDASSLLDRYGSYLDMLKTFKTSLAIGEEFYK
jgi:hypothetical protein